MSGKHPSHPLLYNIPAPGPARALVKRKERRGPLKRLTAPAEAAAVLDAWGASRVRISAETGLSLSRISELRHEQLYLERRREEMDRVLGELEIRLQRDKQAAFEASEDARAKLVALLDARDPSGNPLLGVQQKAAQILLEDKARTSEFEKTRSDPNVSVGVGVGAVFHVFPDGRMESADSLAADIQVIEDAVLEEKEER